MIDPRNLVTLSGRLVADPEIMKDKVVRGAIAVDRAGQENNETIAGFFDFVHFLDAGNDFVKSQITSGKMKKGSSITIVGRLRQEKYLDSQNNKVTKIRLVAEGISYYGFAPLETGASKETTATNDSAAAIPDSW